MAVLFLRMKLHARASVRAFRLLRPSLGPVATCCIASCALLLSTVHSPQRRIEADMITAPRIFRPLFHPRNLVTGIHEIVFEGDCPFVETCVDGSVSSMECFIEPHKASLFDIRIHQVRSLMLPEIGGQVRCRTALVSTLCGPSHRSQQSNPPYTASVNHINYKRPFSLRQKKVFHIVDTA